MPTPSGTSSRFHEDQHSFARPAQVRVRHVALDLDVRFEEKRLSGTATLWLERSDPEAKTLLLDTRALDIRSAEASDSSGPGGTPASWRRAAFALRPADPILGTPLSVELPPGADLTVSWGVWSGPAFARFLFLPDRPDC